MQQLKPGDALLIVDVQNDLFPGGAIAVPEAGGVLPVLNRWMEGARVTAQPIFASRDWHPPDHCSFESQGGSMAVHCVRQTWGAQFHDDLHLEPTVTVISKGEERDVDQQSAFDRTELADLLGREGIRRIFVGGLALDGCVRATVLDGLKAGFAVHLIERASCAASPSPATSERIIKDLRQAGAMIEPTSAGSA